MFLLLLLISICIYIYIYIYIWWLYQQLKKRDLRIIKQSPLQRNIIHLKKNFNCYKSKGMQAFKQVVLSTGSVEKVQCTIFLQCLQVTLEAKTICFTKKRRSRSVSIYLHINFLEFRRHCLLHWMFPHSVRINTWFLNNFWKYWRMLELCFSGKANWICFIDFKKIWGTLKWLGNEGH